MYFYIWHLFLYIYKYTCIYIYIYTHPFFLWIFRTECKGKVGGQARDDNPFQSQPSPCFIQKEGSNKRTNLNEGSKSTPIKYIAHWGGFLGYSVTFVNNCSSLLKSQVTHRTTCSTWSSNHCRELANIWQSFVS